MRSSQTCSVLVVVRSCVQRIGGAASAGRGEDASHAQSRPMLAPCWGPGWVTDGRPRHHLSRQPESVHARDTVMSLGDLYC